MRLFAHEYDHDFSATFAQLNRNWTSVSTRKWVEAKWAFIEKHGSARAGPKFMERTRLLVQYLRREYSLSETTYGEAQGSGCVYEFNKLYFHIIEIVYGTNLFYATIFEVKRHPDGTTTRLARHVSHGSLPITGTTTRPKKGLTRSNTTKW